jgi:hypothetical protein
MKIVVAATSEKNGDIYRRIRLMIFPFQARYGDVFQEIYARKKSR